MQQNQRILLRRSVIKSYVIVTTIGMGFNIKVNESKFNSVIGINFQKPGTIIIGVIWIGIVWWMNRSRRCWNYAQLRNQKLWRQTYEGHAITIHPTPATSWLGSERGCETFSSDGNVWFEPDKHVIAHWVDGNILDPFFTKACQDWRGVVGSSIHNQWIIFTSSWSFEVKVSNNEFNSSSRVSFWKSTKNWNLTV